MTFRFCAGTCFADHNPLGPCPSLHRSRCRLLRRPFSPNSSLLRLKLTSRVRACSARAPRLPDADQTALLRWVKHKISGARPRSSCTCPVLRPFWVVQTLALTRPAFRLRNSVSTQDINLSEAQWLAYALPTGRNSPRENFFGSLLSAFTLLRRHKEISICALRGY